jgi:uncharacterized membrane protein HdeD (DUF308 family)
MRIRKFFWIALTGVILGLAAQMTAWKFAARASYSHRLRPVSSAMSPHEEVAAQRYRATAHTAFVLGVAFAAAGVLSILLSYRADEPASRSVVVALLVLYIILWFGAV